MRQWSGFDELAAETGCEWWNPTTSGSVVGPPRSSLLNVKRLRARGRAAGIGRDLVDPGFGLAKQLLAAAF